MTEMDPQNSDEKKSKLSRLNNKPIALYIGVAVLILIIGFFFPGISDEVVLEIAWGIIVAFTEIKKKIEASTKQKG